MAYLLDVAGIEGAATLMTTRPRLCARDQNESSTQARAGRQPGGASEGSRCV